MIIYYRNTDLELKKIDLANAIDVTINGIKITERGDELQLSVENQIQINPIASNTIKVKEGGF